MNNQQIKWASLHDWYSHSNGNTVYVIDYVINVDTNNVVTNKVVPFTDFQALREWAGY
jgi:hypothetical protein